MQFKNRFILRGIITGASTATPFFARTKQVSREAPLVTGPRKKHRIRSSELPVGKASLHQPLAT